MNIPKVLITLEDMINVDNMLTVVGSYCPYCGERHDRDGEELSPDASRLCKKCCENLYIEKVASVGGSNNHQVSDAVDRLANAGKLPTFREISWTDFKEAAGDIHTECITYTRNPPADRLTDTIRVLHMSTDLDAANVEIVMMTNFMKAQGFQYKRVLDEPNLWTADMLILDGDRGSQYNVNVIGDCITRLAGIMRDWDVLVYKSDSNGTFMIKEPGNPLYSGRCFGLDGTRMLHTYLRLRDHPHFWIGFFAGMSYDIELFVDSMICSNGMDLAKGLRRMKCEFRRAGIYNDDAKLFFAVADLVRELRTAMVHYYMRNGKNRLKKVMYGFRDVAGCCGRNDLFHGSEVFGEPYGWHRYFTRVALATRRWMHDCREITKS